MGVYIGYGHGVYGSSKGKIKVFSEIWSNLE